MAAPSNFRELGVVVDAVPLVGKIYVPQALRDAVLVSHISEFVFGQFRLEIRRRVGCGVTKWGDGRRTSTLN